MTSFAKRYEWIIDILFVVAFVLYCLPANAQDVAQVAASGGGLWPLVVVAVIGAAVAGFYFWHKRNPSKADAALHTAVADVQGALSTIATTATQAVHGLQQTVAKQAAVIASPPVQAAINAQPPAAVGAPTPEPTGAPMSCSQEQRELVCRSIAFGPVDPYTKKLNSPEYAPQLIGGSVGATKSAYAGGGQCNAGDNGYYNAHTNPGAFGWKWANNTWNPPAEPGPPPGENMIWNGKNFV